MAQGPGQGREKENQRYRLSWPAVNPAQRPADDQPDCTGQGEECKQGDQKFWGDLRLDGVLEQIGEKLAEFQPENQQYQKTDGAPFFYLEGLVQHRERRVKQSGEVQYSEIDDMVVERARAG